MQSVGSCRIKRHIVIYGFVVGVPATTSRVVKEITMSLVVLLETLEAEFDERKVRRCERLLRASRLPPAKTLQTLDSKRLPKAVAPRLHELATGDFLERAANVLVFGLPGTGKTHAACALGHALVQRGHSVLFSPTFQLVQELLAAKRDLALPHQQPRRRRVAPALRRSVARQRCHGSAAAPRARDHDRGRVVPQSAQEAAGRADGWVITSAELRRGASAHLRSA